MRKTLFAISLSLILGWFLLLPGEMSAGELDGPGAINGSLINGTTGEPVSEIEVILKKYDGDQEQEREGQKTFSDLKGKFFFSNLELGKEHTYVLQTTYKGVEYDSPHIVFDGKSQEIPVEMTVYETTDSDRKISIAMHHVIMEPKEGSLLVRELMILKNRDNKVYVGTHEIAPDKKETLRISMPSQAQDLQLFRGLMGCCIVQMQDGFADTMDIKPGRKEIQFAYKIDYRTSNMNLSKKINLTTDSLDFFIPQGIRATGENIQYAGLIGEPGKQFLHFSGKKLARGLQVALNISDLPLGTKLFKKITPLLGVSLILLGLIYPLVRRWKKPGETEMATGQEPNAITMPQDERQVILRAIAELDDRLDSGEISSEEHEKKRRILKERAIELQRLCESMGHRKSEKK